MGASSVHRPAWEDPNPSPRSGRPAVRQLLMVKYASEVGASFPGRTWIWRRLVSMAFLPARGDLVGLFPGDANGFPVRERRFAWNGEAEIELATMSVNPPAPIAPAFQRDFTELPWYTDQEGVADLDGELTRGGWAK